MNQRPLRWFILLSGAPAGMPKDDPRPIDTEQPRLMDESFVTGDGTILPLRLWQPAGAPEAIILALHGVNDYSRAFERLRGGRHAAGRSARSASRRVARRALVLAG